MHDSEGYEAGEDGKFKKLEGFLKSRSGERVDPGQKIHVVWSVYFLPFVRTVFMSPEKALHRHTQGRRQADPNRGREDIPIMC